MRPVKALLWDAMGRVPDHVVNDCVEASGRLREVVGYFNGTDGAYPCFSGLDASMSGLLKGL